MGPASPSRGLPAHAAWRWLLLSAQRREGPPSLGFQLPQLLGGEVGGAQRADLLCLQRLGLRPRRRIGAMTGIDVLGSGLSHEDLLSTCSHKKPGRCSERGPRGHAGDAEVRTLALQLLAV